MIYGCSCSTNLSAAPPKAVAAPEQVPSWKYRAISEKCLDKNRALESRLTETSRRKLPLSSSSPQSGGGAALSEVEGPFFAAAAVFAQFFIVAAAAVKYTELYYSFAAAAARVLFSKDLPITRLFRFSLTHDSWAAAQIMVMPG